ncbi:pogo transposable element with ZNF domain isoform X2 [Triplophysa rosa]|uniref:pogo transposable element with ZNF domain isoform X2 n=1 Tax=Triplophysa rosa TaxID=992332 RepID=UPI002546145D|nr:pogo transposable element with ZNF domain isoform X2 [Triplophysa rosa]
MEPKGTSLMCAVRGCHNSWYKRQKFLQNICFDHNPRTRAECGCGARYDLHPPPKEEESLRLWLKTLNLKHPPKRPYVCSFHFVDRRPTEDHPFPEKWLGYDAPVKTRRRRPVRTVAQTDKSGNTVLSSAPPDGTCSKEPPAAADITQQAVPLANAPAVVLSNAVQPNVAGGGTLGQTIYITTQTNPGQPLSSPPGLGTSVGYILNGQPITFLTPAQAPQLLSPRMVTTGSAAQPVSPGNMSRLQIPVTLNTSNLQSVTSVAPGMTSLNMTPSSILPTTATGTTVKVIKLTKLNVGAAAAAGLVLSHPSQPTKAITMQTKTTTRPPGQRQSQTEKRQAQNPAARPVTTTNVFKKGSNLSAVCVRCKYRYQKSEALRGYFCQCNQELIGSVWRLKSKTKKSKCPSEKSGSQPSMLETPVSFSKSSESSLKHVTASELPAGVPSPGSGDLDNQGRLIMLVEDFFYGQRPGRTTNIETRRETVIMKCQLCDKRLMGNIKLMNHMRHHIEVEHLSGEMDSHTMCHHCFRNFSTPFQLQCHVESVHSQVESSKVCRICEWSFDNEPLFLNHMKHAHKPGEMPYICQVCDFRSSFFPDVINHFAELHKDTCVLMCIYCLKVFKSCTSYQVHYLKHQKKSVLHCDKCRLQFLFAKEKIEHKHRFHRTCVKPKQLQGLRPGTRVIIRAYATNQVPDSPSNSHVGASQMNTSTSSESKISSDTTSTTPASQNVTNTVIPEKKKPVENMVELMVKFEQQYNDIEKQFCIECSYEIPGFSNHFPTYVRCSLCRYHTCCSRAYANHMISEHVSHKSTRKYITLYKSCPKRGRLSCTDCKYKTQIGDLMARHLTKFPTHQASRCTLREGFSRGFKRFVFIPTDLIKGGQRLNMRSLLPLQVDKISYPFPKPHPRPSYIITLPAGPAHTPSLPIQVDNIKPSVPNQNCEAKQDATRSILNGRSSRMDLGKMVEKSPQLKTVLYALCSGVPQAANHFGTQPEEIQSLLLKRKHQLQSLRSAESSIPQAADRLVEWVLYQREQQLPIDEANLFNKASEFMRSDGATIISYDWVVDFLLRHDLGLQAFATSRKLLPQKSQELLRSFISILNRQIASQSFRLSGIGAMDELSVFIDMEQLDGASADSSSMMSAFKLMGTSAPLIDVVFTALADGTMLSTMLFLKGEPFSPDAPSLPDFIILEAKPEGFTNEERLEIWLNKVWRPHVNPSSGGKGLLIMDTYKGHMADDFLTALNSANTLPTVIPRSTSRRLQPLEACAGPVLREFLQACWSQHVTSEPQELVEAKPADLARILSGWLVEILNVLRAKPKLLFRSFDQVLSTNPESTSEEPSELMRSLTEALFASKLQEDEAVKQQISTVAQHDASPGVVSPKSLPSPSAGILALKKIFEKDSDVESFHGFEDTELMDH